MKPLADKIKKLMLEKGLSQTHLVMETGLSRQFFHSLNHGQRIKLESVLDVARAIKLKRRQRNELVREWMLLRLGARLAKDFIIMIPE